MNRRRFLRLGAGAALLGGAAPLLGQVRVDEPGAAPGVTPLEIRLGTSLGLTGLDGPRAYDYLMGFVTYLNGVNARGGIHGRRSTLLALDHGDRPENAVRNTLGFLGESDVFSLAAYGDTASVQAVLPLLHRSRFRSEAPSDPPLFGAMCGPRSLYRPPHRERVFCLRPSFDEEAIALVDHLVAEGRERPAVCYGAGPSGRALQRAFVDALRRHGLRPVAEARCSSADLVPAFEVLERNRPDVVFLALPTPGVEGWTSLSFERRRPVALALPSTVDGRQVLLHAERTGIGSDVELTQSRAVPVVSEGGPEAEALRRASREHPADLPRKWLPAGRSPDDRPSSAAVLEGFLTARALCRALEQAGPDLDRSSFRRAWGSLEISPESPSSQDPRQLESPPDGPTPEEEPRGGDGEPVDADAPEAPAFPWKTAVVLARAVDGRFKTLVRPPAVDASPTSEAEP